MSARERAVEAINDRASDRAQVGGKTVTPEDAVAALEDAGLRVVGAVPAQTSGEPNYLTTFHEFWAVLVGNDDGALDFDKVARELHDYRGVMEEASKVYDELAGLSKPNTAAHHVIAFTRQREAASLAGDLRDFLGLHEGGNADELRAGLREWLDDVESEAGE